MNNNGLDELKVSIKYGELEVNFSGSYDTVWKSINNFLKEMSFKLTKKRGSISIKGKTVNKIIQDLIQHGFFEEEKTSSETVKKIRELGKTDVTREAVLMVLKDLTEKGELIRRQVGKKYLYKCQWS